MKITKPMLAVACEEADKLTFPILATPKLDGIRCLKLDGKALSRKFKPIPNHFIRTWIEQNCPNGFDGEIMIPGADFNEVQSKVMTEEGTPDFQYFVFDYVKEELAKPYKDRMEDLRSWMQIARNMTKVVILLPIELLNAVELAQYEKQCLIDGYEGIMVRKPSGPYKCGRSTLREEYLLKIKRFKDAEAEVIGFEEKLHNDNEATIDELGHTKRSSHKANLRPAGTLGTLLVRDIKTKIEFGIGTGFDDATKLDIWKNRDHYMGKVVTYRFQEAGMLEKPRFPSFKGFRDRRDFDE